MTLHFLAHVVLSAALLLLVAQVVPGIHLRGALSALLAALALGFVNSLVRPLLILFTLPLTLLSFGLFLLVVNGVAFKLSAFLVPGFRVRGLLAAVAGSLLMTGLNLMVEVTIGAG